MLFERDGGEGRGDGPGGGWHDIAALGEVRRKPRAVRSTGQGERTARLHNRPEVRINSMSGKRGSEEKSPKFESWS